MRLKSCNKGFLLFLALVCMIQLQFAASYRSEIEITPAPETEETTTKKSGGFFSGIKNFFRGSSTTTPVPAFVAPTPRTTYQSPSAHSPLAPVPSTATAANGAQRPTPFNIGSPQLMPLGPRPDTPPSTHYNLQPQWPQQQPQQQPQPQPAGTTSTARPLYSGMHHPAVAPTNNVLATDNSRQPSLPPGFAPYRPPKPQPSGIDLSYGGGAQPQYNNFGRPGIPLAPLSSSTTTTSTTTTTTTTQRTPTAASNPFDFDLRMNDNRKDAYPASPTPRRPAIKEDFPALPAPKSPNTPIPASPLRPSSPSSPSAWNNPLPTAGSTANNQRNGAPAPVSPTAWGAGSNGVSFVPHTDSSSTVRPGTTGGHIGTSKAAMDELYTLTEALFAKETNGQYSNLRVNPQGKTRSIDSADEAPEPLLTVEDRALESPTIAKMRVLFNNYEEDTLTNEYVTPNERREENEFVDAIMSTQVMRHAMLFLQNKGIVTADPKTHRDLIKELWFTQYSRGSGKIGSSGFEHVFVHEVKNGTLIGLHNWVYFYEQEKAGNLDYKGWLKQLDLGTKGKIMKVRFVESGVNKPVNTLFIGTSPELEMALYTVCHQLKADQECPVSLGNNRFNIVTYSWRYRGKSLIGSAYPEI